MNREKIDKLIEMSMHKREKLGIPIFPWEDSRKSFFSIKREGVEKILRVNATNTVEPCILKCVFKGKNYYFGAGATSEKLTANMMANGKWYVYTWDNC